MRKEDVPTSYGKLLNRYCNSVLLRKISKIIHIVMPVKMLRNMPMNTFGSKYAVIRLEGEGRE